MSPLPRAAALMGLAVLVLPAVLVPTATATGAVRAAGAAGAVGAVGAQGVFDMGTLTNTMAQGAVVESERKRSIRTGKGDPLRGGSRAKLASKATLLYTPNLTARKRNLANFAARMEKSDPTTANNLRTTFAKTDVIVAAGNAMRAFGLNPNNVADAMAAYLVTAWHGTRGSTDGTKAQYQAVSAQLTRTALAVPTITKATNSVKQETAEAMMLYTLMVDASVTAAKKDPTTLPAIRTAIGQGARSTFGFDLAAMNLGANGLTKK